MSDVWGGWQKLYEEYTAKLETTGAEIAYVKEKYGALIFQVEAPCSDEIQALVEEVKKKSLYVCVDCGNDGGEPYHIDGWYSTLCPNCVEGRLSENPHMPHPVPIPRIHR